MTEPDLVSVRGLVDSDFESPLRKFTGVFDSYEKVPASGYEGWRVNLNFKDLDNVATAPGQVYNFPTAVLNLSLSNKHKSIFGYFGDSIGELIPPDEDIKEQCGKTMTLVFCDGVDGRPKPKPIWSKNADTAEYPNKMVPTPVWIVESVEGVTAGAAVESGVSATDWAEENLIGKTRAQFNKWAFADPKVRKDTGLQRSITDKSFINSLVQLKRVVEDEDGVFQLPTVKEDADLPEA